MINKNQYEKSVIMLKTTLPVFVRKAYEEFVKCLNEIAAEYGKASKDRPHSVEVACEKLFNSHDFFSLYFGSFKQDVISVRLSRACDSMRTFKEGNTLSKDEEFYTINGPDIFAPLTSIEAAVTLLGLTKGTYTGNSPIPLCFEVVKGPQVSTYKANDVTDLKWSEVEGLNGTKTVLDNLSSRLVIDLGKLFNTFFAKLAEGYTVNNIPNGEDEAVSPLRNLEAFCKLAAVANESDKATAIVENTVCVLMPSAITTYFVFASRLVGAKNDIYQWMYTSFVKDSVTHFDIVNYPTRAPVSIASGHADAYGRPHGIKEEREVAGNPLMDSDPVRDENIERLKRIMIYRNIRMQYSVWASVINAVLSSRITVPGYLKWQQSKEKVAGFGLCCDSITYNVLQLAVNALYCYIKARYRTYNLTQQIDPKTNTPYQSVSTMGYAIDRIKDDEAISIVKNVIAGKKVEDSLCKTTVDDYKVLGVSNIAENQLSEIVLHSSYCLLMVKMIASLGKAKDYTEPATGRPAKDVFAEIFYGVLNGISEKYKYITRFVGSDWLGCDCISESAFNVLKEVTKYYSPLTGINCCNCYEPATTIERADKVSTSVYISGNKENPYVSDSLNKILDELGFFQDEEDIAYNTGHNVCDIPLFSDILDLKSLIKFDMAVFNDYGVNPKVIDARLNDKNNQSMFPKNRLILEGIEKMNFSSSRVFNSLESANRAIEDLELASELGFEGADAMANNSCYSSLAATCGGIASMEITNDGAAIDVDSNGENGTITQASPTDANDYLLGPTPTDPKNQAEVTKHSMESAHQEVEKELMHNEMYKTSESINKLFNKIVLGIK